MRFASMEDAVNFFVSSRSLDAKAGSVNLRRCETLFQQLKNVIEIELPSLTQKHSQLVRDVVSAQAALDKCRRLQENGEIPTSLKILKPPSIPADVVPQFDQKIKEIIKTAEESLFNVVVDARTLNC